MEQLHNLLIRQLKQHYGEFEQVPDGLRQFIETVDIAYKAFDEDRAMLERSLDLSSQELLQANLEIRSVLQALPDLFLWLDANGKIISSKEGSQTDLLLPSEKLIGKRIQEIPQQELRAKFQEAFDRLHKTKAMVNIEYSIAKENKEQYYEARLLPLLEGNSIIVIRNITDRKKAEQSLAAEKEHLAVTLRSIGDGVITTDTKGTIVLVNQVAEELTGWAQEEAIGKPLQELFQINNKESSVDNDNIGHVLLESGEFDKPTNQTFLIKSTDKNRIISSNRTPLHDEDNNIIGLVLVFRDITDTQILEAERLKATKLESIGILAGGIAHDFNNYLSSILGSISLAQTYLKTDEKVMAILAEADKASTRARELTQQLLTFSKGGVPIKKTSSITECVMDASSFALRGSNVSCKYSFPDDLWLIDADTGQIGQVFHNLALNADQAMPEGGIIEINAQNMQVTAKDSLPLSIGKYVKISVTDHGTGIPQEHLNKIFDPYFTTKQKGSGLGLAVAYSIMKNHDGLITANSEIGTGTNFNIYLPASEGNNKQQERSDSDIFMGEGKVLIMDDEEMVRNVVARMLNRLGYKTDSAKDGQEAIECYKKAKESGELFDAVLMDLTIPGGMGGTETMQVLRKIDPEIKVIVSSGYANDPILANYKEWGFCDVIPKPYRVQELSKVLHENI